MIDKISQEISINDVRKKNQNTSSILIGTAVLEDRVHQIYSLDV